LTTTKVKKQDGYHCFYCNAGVEENAEHCNGCGRNFTKPKETPAPPRREKPADRVKQTFRSRRRSYWLPLIVLGACVVLLATILRPRSHPRPLLPEPTGARPQYQMITSQDLSTEDVDRLSIVGLVRPDMTDDSLRAVLDWMLYSALDEYNRKQKRAVRVIWAYLLDDSLSPKSSWRAMAIWADPKLAESLRPAGIGGDAVREGPVQYDFTNPIASKGAAGDKGGTK